MQINAEGGGCVYVRRDGESDGGGVDGWVSVGGGFVLSAAACYHPPQPGRQFD